MDAGTVMGLVIITMVALIMLIIGVFQFRKADGPVGFYNTSAPPKKEEITDIIAWNKKHGMIWIIYAVCIESGFFLGYFMPREALQTVFMIGGVIIPLPFMVMRHKTLEGKYKKEVSGNEQSV